MRTNPGGIVSAEDVRGRAKIIAVFWKILANQSLVIAAERRMGKTTIIRKMAEEPPPGTKVIFRDVEGISTTMEFVGRLVSDATPHLSAQGRAYKAFTDFWGKLGGAEFGGVIKFPATSAVHWKEVLERVLNELGSLEGTRILLVWDEFPLMLQNIARVEGMPQVMEILNNLRAMRQTQKVPRMIYTGSVGLHHVIKELRRGAYANSPINDMKTESVDPLSPTDAQSLAAELFEGECLGPDPNGLAAHRLAEAVDCVPFYIHQVVHSMSRDGLSATPENVDRVVDEALRDPQDAWDLQNFRTRLGNYYGVDQDIVEFVLETLAREEPLSLDDLCQRVPSQLASRSSSVASRVPNGDRAAMSTLLALMMKDHYLIRNAAGDFCFRFSIVRRWWQQH